MIETWHKELESLYNQIVSWRRDFHQYPELSFQEIETPRKIAEILKSFHINVKTNIGGRGVIGVIEGGRPGKTIALRADFDEQAMLIGGKLLLSLVNSYVRDEKESFHHVEVKK
ncbi:Amidohydrolase [Bacillus thuringiensis serovar toumanoffi]|uniref:Amidohydrolase n=1 Tax=Bacillus thuringiensis serovar toumanoffi TaxID=180862 RepID=A0ABD5I3Z9_BACTU|nr:Amidohydrolase [Bacillus thuringiensis serovar toumanoffi]